MGITDAAGETLVVALLLMPGFVYVQLRESLVPSPRRDFSKSAAEFAGYSVINYVFFAWYIVPRVDEWSRLAFGWREYGMLIMITLLIPAWLAFLVVRLNPSERVAQLAGQGASRRPQEPAAWDFFFRRRMSPCWVLVRLRNGKAVGGIYADRSYASGYPEDQSLFIERQYVIENGAFKEPSEGAAGVLISGKDIHLVEFWDAPNVPDAEGDHDEQGNPGAGSEEE